MRKKIPKEWEERVRRIAAMTALPNTETQAQKRARLETLKHDYNAFVRYYFPSETDCDCAGYHLEMAHALRDNDKINLLNIIYRGGAKSTHVNMMIPLWLCFFHQSLQYMILCGATGDTAKNLLLALQTQFEYNERLKADFGEQIQSGDWEKGEFSIKQGASFKAIGLNQKPRGLKDMYNRRPDYISVDDVDDRKTARNQVLTTELVSRILGALKPAFQKERQRFAYSNNLIHRQGITAHLISKLRDSKRTHIIWRDALVSRPSPQSALGELLRNKGLRLSHRDAGQAYGTPAWGQRYDTDYWREMQHDTPHAEFRREYCNDPVEEGLVFKCEWIQYTSTADLSQYTDIIGYGDLSYRATGDYKAFAVVGITKNREFHVLNVFLRKTSLQTAVQWAYDYTATLPQGTAISWWVEANFIQDAFIDNFYDEGKARGFYLSVRGDKRAKPNKYERIEQMSPWFERGLLKWSAERKNERMYQAFIDQVLEFEKGAAHDDAPDCLEGGLWLLNHTHKASMFDTILGAFKKSNNRKM